jgi:predicted aminopeptidase
MKFMAQFTVLACFLSLLGCSNLYYITNLGWHQGYITFHSVPVQEVLDDPKLDQDIGEKIRFIQAVKRYGEERMGLRKTSCYSTFYENQGPVLYVVTACEKDRLQAYHLNFPVIGTVTYRGFFSKIDAFREQRELEKNGYDTYLRPAGAYSTLGCLRDPIFSSFMKWDVGSLANLILHEMTHSTCYFKGNTDFIITSM